MIVTIIREFLTNKRQTESLPLTLKKAVSAVPHYLHKMHPTNGSHKMKEKAKAARAKENEANSSAIGVQRDRSLFC